MNPKNDATARPGGTGGGTTSGSHTEYSPCAMSPVQRVLNRLQRVTQHGTRWKALCPVPTHNDHSPSLSVAEGRDGQALLKCHAGCSIEAITAAIGLTVAELFSDSPNLHGKPRRVGGRERYPSEKQCKTATPSSVEREYATANAPEPVQPNTAPAGDAATPPTGCTLAEYADAKRLPNGFLRSIGLSEISYCNAPAVRIPYPMPDGTKGPTRFRVSMTGDKFKWKVGSKTCLYGLNRLSAAREAGHITLAEGESDCHTLWYHEIPALGLAGAANWTEARDSHHLDGIDRIYVIHEADAGGDAVNRWLAGSSIRNRAFLVNLAEATGHKDASSLYLDNPAQFTERWQAALEAARRWPDVAREDAEAASRKAYAEAEPLATKGDILAEFAVAVRRAGLVGEERAAKLLFLALTSRVLDKPVSVAIKGPSSGGKSFTAETVLSFFPATAVYRLSGASALALNFSEESFAHRFLYFAEAAGMGERDGKLQAMLRTLMSEGRLEYDVSVKRPDGTFGTQRMHKDGPTGFLTTTTADGLHAENETRFFSIRTDDSKSQTFAVVAGIFDERPKDTDRAQWHALQEWLAVSDHRVTVPYGPALASLIIPAGNRLRRDMGAIRGLICAHAVLHQRSRERDATGRIVATLADYGAVYALTVDIVSEGVASTVSASTRATVEAVAAAVSEYGFKTGAPVGKIAERLNIDKSAASRRLTSARKAGYVINEESRKGYPARFVVGDPLPNDSSVLPAPDAVARVATI